MKNKNDFKAGCWAIFWLVVLGAVLTAIVAALTTWVVKFVWYS